MPSRECANQCHDGKHTGPRRQWASHRCLHAPSMHPRPLPVSLYPLSLPRDFGGKNIFFFPGARFSRPSQICGVLLIPITAIERVWDGQPDKTASRRGAQKVSQLREISAAFERADDSLAPGNHRLRAFLSHPVAASRFGRKSEPRRSAKTVREGAGRAAGGKSRDSVLSETYHALVLMIRVMFCPALVEARLAGARNKTQFAAANATLIGAARRTYPLPPSLR